MTKHHVKLRKKDREYLEALVARGKLSAKVFKRATGLLELERGKTLQAVAETLGVSSVTVAAWRALPREVYGSWQTGDDRFAEWKRAGVFEQIWARCLHLYDGKHGIAWEWQAAEGTFVRAPTGGKRRRAQSDHRAKPGYKDHLLVDGRGVPLSVVSTAANVNDGPMLSLVLNSLPIARPQPNRRHPHPLCLDAAFDTAQARAVVWVER